MAKRTRRVAADSDDDRDATDYSDQDRQQRPAPEKKKAKGTANRSKAKGKGRAVDDEDVSDDDDDDNDDDSDGTDVGGDGRKGKKAQLTEEEQKFYIQGMVRFVLFNESHRRVLRRQDLVKAVLTDGRGRHFGTLLPKVQKILREVLGLDLCPLRQKETSSGKAQPKAYVVRSTVPLPLLRHLSTHRYPDLSFQADQDHDEDGGGGGGGKKSLRAELAQWNADADSGEHGNQGAVMRDVKREEGALYGILGVVLALILVNGKVLGDDQLVSYLKRLSLFPTTTVPQSLAVPNPDSLTLAQFLSNLVKQQYLERASSGHLGATTQGASTQKKTRRTSSTARSRKSQDANSSTTGGGGGGDPAVEWRWGPRSEVEFGQVGVGQFIHLVFSDPTSLPPRSSSSNTASEATENSGHHKKRDKFLQEVARAAGVKKLAGPAGGVGGAKKGRAGGDDDDHDGGEEGGQESE
ncbi:hypothetical protein JCM3774_005971 [Rhodotorula dairenensis]